MNHRMYLAMAIPLTISTITTPLLGAVDTAVVGQLDDPAYLGGVAVGTVIFNTMYWLFGFLRVSTSGFTAQAHGADSRLQEGLALMRPVMLAVLISSALFILQNPIEAAALAIIQPAADVSNLTSAYFGIRIWGVPFTLLNYVLLGWLLGMGRIKVSVMIQLAMNTLNILLDLLFVLRFSWGIEGVAVATVIAEMTAFVMSLFIIIKSPGFMRSLPPFKASIDFSSFKKMMAVNRDLFIRTICLLTVFNLFTMKGASFGTEMLAANAILIQIHFIMAYFFDGLANASSIFSGKAVGSKDRKLLSELLRLSCQWAVITSLGLAAAYYLLSDSVIRLFTSISSVQLLADQHSAWLILFPLCASLGIVLYGAFTGATETAAIRNSMLIALAVFLVALFIFVPLLQNQGLWLAFTLFSLGRSVFLALYLPRLYSLIPDENSSLSRTI